MLVLTSSSANRYHEKKPNKALRTPPSCLCQLAEPQQSGPQDSPPQTHLVRYSAPKHSCDLANFPLRILEQDLLEPS